eukprot:6464291-Amphidinium_carterae.2
MSEPVKPKGHLDDDDDKCVRAMACSQICACECANVLLKGNCFFIPCVRLSSTQVRHCLVATGPITASRSIAASNWLGIVHACSVVPSGFSAQVQTVTKPKTDSHVFLTPSFSHLP